MIYIHLGSHTYQLLTLLSVAGEYPIRSIHLLGSERVFKILIHKLTTPQTLHNPQTDEELFVARVFSISGKGADKTLKLYKGVLPILTWLDAEEYYRQSFWDHKFPGDAMHRYRNHRVAEAVAMCMQAGIEFRPYRLPKLQNKAILNILPKAPIFYPAKCLKFIGEMELNKTAFSQMVGTLFAGRRCYAVFNTRNVPLKWRGKEEFKMRQNLIEIASLNANIFEADSAILFGANEDVALETLLILEKSHRLDFRFDSVYQHIYFVPLNQNGIRQLRVFAVQSWEEKLLDMLFEHEYRSYGRGRFEYDAYINGVYILSFLDSDLARLVRFREVVEHDPEEYEVVCYPYQVSLLRKYMGEKVGITTLDLEIVGTELKVERTKSLEKSNFPRLI